MEPCDRVRDLREQENKLTAEADKLKADVEKGLPPKTEINMYIPMTRCAALFC